MGEMKITSEFRMKRQEVCLSDDLDFDSNIVKHAKPGIFVGLCEMNCERGQSASSSKL